MVRLVLSFLALAATHALAQTITTFKVVDLGYAKYQSDVSFSPGVTSFLGIRYASPPTGNLRWRAPQSPLTASTASASVLNATTEGNQCYQGSLYGSPGLSMTSPFRIQAVAKRDDSPALMSEDCLFLNVHVPTILKSNVRLPVIVYIHGGGYDAGNNSIYPAYDFVHDSNYSLIAVNIQYRLGLFGFLPGQEVKNGGDLNAGLLDQQFALQWVQKHIAAFGGNPDEVTIWGQSAGAGSVLQHIVAHAGNTQPPLFRAAMMNSPFLPFQYQYNDSIPETLYKEVVAYANCTGSTDTLTCLRTADPYLLLDADTTIGERNFLGTYTFVPVVDGNFSVERPTVTLARGKVNGDVLLVTSNSHEGDLFVDGIVNGSEVLSPNYTLTEYVTQLFPRLNTTQIQHIVELYSSIPNVTTVLEQAEEVIGDSIFVCPAYYTLEAYGTNAWKGEFAIPPGTHGSDLSYEFTTFGLPPTYNNPAFISAYSQSFLSTAISLNPNVKIVPTILPNWTQWSGSHIEMLFNETETGIPVVDPITTDAGLLTRCGWWNSIAVYNWQ